MVVVTWQGQLAASCARGWFALTNQPTLRAAARQLTNGRQLKETRCPDNGIEAPGVQNDEIDRNKGDSAPNLASSPRPRCLTVLLHKHKHRGTRWSICSEATGPEVRFRICFVTERVLALVSRAKIDLCADPNSAGAAAPCLATTSIPLLQRTGEARKHSTHDTQSRPHRTRLTRTAPGPP